MSQTKRQVRSLLNRLPDDCTLEDVQYHLYVIQKIERGRQSEEAGHVHTQAEIEAYFKQKWQQKSSGATRRGKTSTTSKTTSRKTRPALRKAS